MTTPIDYGSMVATGRQPNQAKRATVASFVGTALEYYDLYIYATASALVFSTVFFPSSGATGLLLALSSYGVAYLARPLGGVLAGHFGDRFGRRKVLLAILLVMGFATFAIGCLPSYDSIGVWAPILLVLFRIAQGLSAGGELASSCSFTAEHAPQGHRGFYTSISATGAVFGYLLATLSFMAVAALPKEDMLSWGWRIPFLSSLILVVVGVFVRWWIKEPEIFLKQKSEAKVSRPPLIAVLREQPVDFLRVIASSLQIVLSVIVPVYGLTYATNVAGIASSTMLNIVAVSYFAAMIFLPLGGFLSDKVGRKPVLIAGNLIGALSVWLYFWAVAAGNVPMIYFGMFLSFSIAWGLINGVYPIFYSELFSTRFRITGFAVGLQIGLILTGFSPLIAQLLSTANDNAWWPVALVSSVCSVVAALTIGSSRETYKSSLNGT
ncbi:MFS transporter [Pseudomonas sp. FW305-E2]|uniref:MFS transporter n=1 Tax=Pseudomonas sp. FW305-E2 TaxID=2075558 RepID=UPI000B4FCC08|nr:MULTISPECIES: MFS transporter [Pseudomonas]POA81654.1 MFS transporter [Pseudomonas sp. FW305-E2]